jgi:molybdate transport system permease protein
VNRGDPDSLTGIPKVLWIPAAFGIALVVLPVVGLLARLDLRRLPAELTGPAALEALWLSVRTSAAATGLCLVLGVPLAVVLARSRRPGPLRAVVLLPLVLPPVVGGLALLYLLGRNGLFGQWLYLGFGIRIPFTTTAVVLAQAFVALPFLVISLEGALRTFGDRYERTAATLGAAPGRTFWWVTVPLLAPAIGSGLLLAFARSLGEFGATIVFAGSAQGRTRTLPLEIYLRRESDVDSATALSVLLVVVALVVVVLARPRTVGRSG